VTSLRDRILAWYHQQRFRAFSLQVGTQYFDQGSFEDAWWEYYKGNEAYAEVALKYLGMTRALETARSPHAASFYILEEGEVRRSVPLLEQCIAGFDPFWEREPTAEALAALIPLLSDRADRARRRDDISRLYRINPGALPQAGIGLPLAVSFEGTGWREREKAMVLRFLRRSGSECIEGPQAGVPYALRLEKRAAARDEGGDGGRTVHWTVSDSSGGIIHEGKPVASGSLRRRSASLVSEILEELYAVH